MALRKLKTISLTEALQDMEIGECCIVPDEITRFQLRNAINKLKEQGNAFTTSTRPGEYVVSRVK